MASHQQQNQAQDVLSTILDDVNGGRSLDNLDVEPGHHSSRNRKLKLAIPLIFLLRLCVFVFGLTTTFINYESSHLWPRKVVFLLCCAILIWNLISGACSLLGHAVVSSPKKIIYFPRVHFVVAGKDVIDAGGEGEDDEVRMRRTARVWVATVDALLGVATLVFLVLAVELTGLDVTTRVEVGILIAFEMIVAALQPLEVVERRRLSAGLGLEDVYESGNPLGRIRL